MAKKAGRKDDRVAKAGASEIADSDLEKVQGGAAFFDEADALFGSGPQLNDLKIKSSPTNIRANNIRAIKNK